MSIEDDEKFYGDAKTYWEGITPTVDGMLGGFAKISPTDINGSHAFLRPLLVVGGGKTEMTRALDCGAGIGRITKRLLLPIFKTVDMVELNQKFLDEARSFIGEEESRVDNLFCSGLQDFIAKAGTYDVIWCQWVLGHLTDEHLLNFLKRCQSGLTTNGIIILKENISGEEREFDELDSSYTRTREELDKVILQSGLEIIKCEKQKGFPKGLYDVYMYALQ
ncbi:N-terminal Xaa-Pro-Lys N-methyltransferase 1-A-like [Ostrea edulis]|uniref:N-terminal Xaa-Pro-Lys N-methyltransferase 1-A-like n=1 Tax=Ostrea edulis TaxID=37623 RepID=UPI00209469E4|nr:N-terminal Xaa-Pro-Lys N-methyltransferase 1-A-like [Ostrea edulis]